VDVNKLKLLMREDLPIGELTFIQPTIRDIIAKTYEEHIKDIYYFYNIKDIFIESVAVSNFFEDNDMDNFKALSYLLDTAKNDIAPSVIKFLESHFKEKFSIEDGKIISENGVLITSTLYNDICDVLFICYSLPERLDNMGFEKNGKKMKIGLIRTQRARERKRKKRNVDNTFFNMISVLKTKTGVDDILKMSMLEAIDYYKRIHNEKNYEALLNGIYNGNIDQKNHKDIWSSD